MRSIVVCQVAFELADLAEGKETIQLANTGPDNPVRRILDVMLEPKDPRWCMVFVPVWVCVAST